uniref:RNA uridylyltransferase n=1 Tax=Eutreptiella gymnastica TaxID=73025 RepID=A0A7S4GFV2_9EUGL
MGAVAGPKASCSVRHAHQPHAPQPPADLPPSPPTKAPVCPAPPAPAKVEGTAAGRPDGTSLPAPAPLRDGAEAAAKERRHAHACPIREKRLRDLKGVRALVQGLRSIDDSPVSIAFLGKSVKWRRSEMGDLQRFLQRFNSLFVRSGAASQEVALSDAAPEAFETLVQHLEKRTVAEGKRLTQAQQDRLIVERMVSYFPLSNEVHVSHLEWSSYGPTLGRLQPFLNAFPDIFDTSEYPKVYLRPGSERFIQDPNLSRRPVAPTPTSKLPPPKRAFLTAHADALAVIPKFVDVSVPGLNLTGIGAAMQDLLRRHLPTISGFVCRERFRKKVEDVLNRALQQHQMASPCGEEQEEKFRCKVWMFGSSSTGLFEVNSDVDLLVTPVAHMRCPQEWLDAASEVERLHVLKDRLMESGLGPLGVVESARVPIVKPSEALPGEMNFDICLRSFGALNSQYLRRVFQKDGLVRDTALYLKHFAKDKGIINSQGGLLSAYSLNIMVVYFFHCYRGFVLPALSEVTSPEVVQPPSEQELTIGTAPEELAQAVLELLQFYTMQFNPQLDCISIDGRSQEELTELKQKAYLCVADPYERYFNLGAKIDAARWKLIVVTFYRHLLELMGERPP